MNAVIAGAGSYGEVYLSYIREQGEFDVIGFIDDDEHKIGMTIRGVPVISTTHDLETLQKKSVSAVFAPIGDNTHRSEILHRVRDAGLNTPSFIHATAIISRDAELHTCVYILPGSIIMPYASIHDGVMVSMGSKIAHHTILEAGVFVSTGCNVGAGITVKEYAFLGIGCTIMTGVNVVGARAIVGAGAVVVRDVPDGVKVAGVPARVLT